MIWNGKGLNHEKGIKSPHWIHSIKREKNCFICNKVFKKPKWQHHIYGRGGWDKRKYCSIKCASRASLPSRIKALKANPTWIGRHHKEETKKKMSEQKKIWFQTHPNPNKGKFRPKARKENKEKWNEFRKQLRERLEYKNWRETIFKRDNWTCIRCNKKGVKLEADHIKPAKLFPHLILEISNGQTLCKVCHNKKFVEDYEKYKWKKLPEIPPFIYYANKDWELDEVYFDIQNLKIKYKPRSS